MLLPLKEKFFLTGKINVVIKRLGDVGTNYVFASGATSLFLTILRSIKLIESTQLLEMS